MDLKIFAISAHYSTAAQIGQSFFKLASVSYWHDPSSPWLISHFLVQDIPASSRKCVDPDQETAICLKNVGT